MRTFDRFLCIIGAHRWVDAVDPETGALFQRCVTCAKETDTAPWARGRTGPGPGLPNEFGAPPSDTSI